MRSYYFREVSFAQNDIWRFAPLGSAGYWFIPVPYNIPLYGCRSTLHSLHPSLSSDGLFLFLLAVLLGLSEPWYTLRDLYCPSLISSALRVGTLPEHYLRSLGKLLGQPPIFFVETVHLSLAIRMYYVEECPVILSLTAHYSLRCLVFLKSA